MEEKNNEAESEKAVFNMALDTLQRLGKNLQEQKELSYKYELPEYVLQAIKIGLVKQFFVQASPLLPEETVKKYRKEILSLSPKLKETYKKHPGNADELIGSQPFYDIYLEVRLNEIIIELQMILQKEKYFMPSYEDEGDF